jgi:hypothetical protein
MKEVQTPKVARDVESVISMGASKSLPLIFIRTVLAFANNWAGEMMISANANEPASSRFILSLLERTRTGACPPIRLLQVASLGLG